MLWRTSEVRTPLSTCLFSISSLVKILYCARLLPGNEAKLMFKPFKEPTEGGTFSLVCSEQLLWAVTPTGAKTRDHTYGWRRGQDFFWLLHSLGEALRDFSQNPSEKNIRKSESGRMEFYLVIACNRGFPMEPFVLPAPSRSAQTWRFS